jgi:glutamate/tyrosine decarboxylase-like PLP-dependent enzyme
MSDADAKAGSEENRRRRPRPPASDRFGWHPEPNLIGLDDASSLEALAALGEDAWGAALDWLRDEAGRRPVAGLPYKEMRARFYGGRGGPSPAPNEPSTWAAVQADIRERLAPYQYAAQHPAQFAYFTPPPLPVAVASEAMAAWLNQGVDVWACSPTSAFVEEEVVSWLRTVVGFDDAGWGVLTSGGVMANFMALAVARDIHLRHARGLDGPPRGSALDGVRVYASDQAHFSIARGLSWLGFPAHTLRILPSDNRFRLRGDVLRAAVEEDRAAGLLPWCVAAVSGSTNTGSVDAVRELAEVSAAAGMWLHVDAAYGGAVRLSADEAWRVPDLELADSVTIDPHKWFFQPYDIGALMVKRHDDLLTTFHGTPEYYRHPRPGEEPLSWYMYSFEGTRRFRALKLWVSWKHLGTSGFGRLIESNLRVARHLAARCAESDEFEACPPEPELSVVCFRHLPGGAEAAAGMDPSDLDAHQDRLQRRLEASGEGWVSTTTLRGRTYLRAGVVNYLATTEDVDHVLATLRRLAAGDHAAEAAPPAR